MLGRILDVVNLFAYLIGAVLAFGLLIAWWAPDSIGVPVVAGMYVGWIYLTVRWEARGGSPLRQSIGMKIVDIDTHLPIGYPRAIGRLLVKFFSSFMMIGYLWMLWDPKKQTWHDKATNSTVILVRK